jgi:MinD-like ATPase involved in chromosome partitioning or flagellar assembly
MAGWVPRDACVERAVREQRPMVLYFPYARASEAIKGIAARLERREEAQDRRAFWQRLVESSEMV